MRRLAFPAVIAAGLTLGIALPGAGAPAAAAGEPVPHCQPVTVTTPWRTFTIRACDSGLRDPAPGKEWQWVVDGSALKGGAVVFGAQVPRQH